MTNLPAELPPESVAEGDPGGLTPVRYLRSGGVFVIGSLLLLLWPTLVIFSVQDWRESTPAGTLPVVLLALLPLGTATWLIILVGRGLPPASRRARSIAAGCAVSAILLASVAAMLRQDSDGSDRVLIATLAMVSIVVPLVSWRWGLLATVTVALLSVWVSGRPAELWLYVALHGSNFVFCRLVMWVHDLIHRMDDARRTIAMLSLQQERQRFARDLHDVMGRSLSAIALKAELGLAGDDLTRTQQLTEVRGIAQSSLAQMRQLVTGYRGIDLETELDDACAILRAAGVYVEVDSDGADCLDVRASQIGGWVVREGVTNILRHAPHATEADIVVRDGRIRITNDGVETRSVEVAEGNGLSGLRERVAQVGGRVEVERLGSRFCLLADLRTGAG